MGGFTGYTGHLPRFYLEIFACQRGVNIFSLRLPPHWPGYILRLISGGGANSLRGGGHYIFIYDCHRFYGLCFTMGANVILGGHGYNKLIVGHPLCRGRYRRVGMGGV